MTFFHWRHIRPRPADVQRYREAVEASRACTLDPMTLYNYWNEPILRRPFKLARLLWQRREVEIE